ncbi:SUKH-4 family immunity protein [Kitasatospora sp. NPDC053057]|uniref:SUKH-4 family immunity protein n=1 Tax=Kitasatospora sp. NPDC053057 TaxID=3364062 RepID=UPI0037CACADC
MPDVTDLPEALTHGPSREHLLTVGLPESGAFLEFGAPVSSPTGGGRWLVLGEAAYGDSVVLDGATGELWLGEGADPEAGGDLLASSLPALVALIREVEAVATGAADPDAHGGRRGAVVADAVVAAAEQRMRAVDGPLFARTARPAHWCTALLVASLAWGARPGEPGGPAYVFEPDLVADLARLVGDDGGVVRRYRAEDLPAELTHEPTRRLLVEAGLPLDSEMLGVDPDEPLTTMARPHSDRLALAYWPHDLVIGLDGATGRLELPDLYDAGDPALYLHRDLSALLYALWTYERLRADWERWEYGDDEGEGEDWQVFDPQALLRAVVDELVERVDPEAWATPRHSWRLLAEDPYTGGLLA